MEPNPRIITPQLETIWRAVNEELPGLAHNPYCWRILAALITDLESDNASRSIDVSADDRKRARKPRIVYGAKIRS